MSNWDLVLAYTEEYATWLGERGHPHPPVRAGNRLPAPAEVLAVLAALPGADLEVAGRDALVLPRGGGTGGYELMVQAPPGTSWDVDAWDEAGSFTVKGNRETAVSVVVALAAAAGQLLIYPDTGAVPLIVDATDDPVEVALLWAGSAPDDWEAFHRLRHG